MSGEVGSLTCAAALTVLVLMVVLANGVRIAPEYQRVVVFRLGRCIGTRGPGLYFMMPAIDRGVRVDLREQAREVPPQSMSTKDNIPVSIRYAWQYKVTDPMAFVIQVGNFETAATGLGLVTMRSIVGDRALVELLAGPEKLGLDTVSKLNEVAERWGARVTHVAIHEIVAPKEVQEALSQKLDAQRVLKALGSSLVKKAGEAQTGIHAEGKVLIDGHSWEALSKRPIVSGKKVHVERVILEVAED